MPVSSVKVNWGSIETQLAEINDFGKPTAQNVVVVCAIFWVADNVPPRLNGRYLPA